MSEQIIPILVNVSKTVTYQLGQTDFYAQVTTFKGRIYTSIKMEVMREFDVPIQRKVTVFATSFKKDSGEMQMAQNELNRLLRDKNTIGLWLDQMDP